MSTTRARNIRFREPRRPGERCGVDGGAAGNVDAKEHDHAPVVGWTKARPADHACSLAASMVRPDNGPALGAFQDGGATQRKGLWIFGGRPVNSLWITATTGGTGCADRPVVAGNP
jgi:hypothetical protein